MQGEKETMNTMFSKKPLVLAVGAALAGTSPQLLAQDGADEAIEEIMVTASRREQRIEDLFLQLLGREECGDFEEFLANGDIPLSAAATVATYVDNTPLFANFLLKDIERVEVMRGPQGTLYGSSALGGTVRYIMNRPDASGFDASVGLTYGQTEHSDGNNVSLDGMVNIPLRRERRRHRLRQSLPDPGRQARRGG